MTPRTDAVSGLCQPVPTRISARPSANGDEQATVVARLAPGVLVERAHAVGFAEHALAATPARFRASPATKAPRPRRGVSFVEFGHIDRRRSLRRFAPCGSDGARASRRPQPHARLRRSYDGVHSLEPRCASGARLFRASRPPRLGRLVARDSRSTQFHKSAPFRLLSNTASTVGFSPAGGPRSRIRRRGPPAFRAPVVLFALKQRDRGECLLLQQ